MVVTYNVLLCPTCGETVLIYNLTDNGCTYCAPEEEEEAGE